MEMMRSPWEAELIKRVAALKVGDGRLIVAQIKCVNNPALKQWSEN